MSKRPKIEFYQETSMKRGRWRWRVKGRNGRILADSGEAYSSRRAVERGMARLLVELPLSIVVWPK